MGFSRQEYWMGCHFLLLGIFRPRDRAQVSCRVNRLFTDWATREEQCRPGFKSLLHRINIPHLIYPFICWRKVNLLHGLAIVNSAAMNIGVHVSFWIRVFSGYMPRSGVAGSYGITLFLGFKEPPYCVQSAQAAVTKYHRLQGLNKSFIYCSPGGWKSKTRCQHGRVLDSFPGCFPQWLYQFTFSTASLEPHSEWSHHPAWWLHVCIPSTWAGGSPAVNSQPGSGTVPLGAR